MSPPDNRPGIERYAKEAIALALQGQWDEAVTANRAILRLWPEDVEAYNRLGRALVEIGDYTAAREAYGHALKLDPYNNIAKKNLSRLSNLGELVPKGDHRRVVIDIFAEEIAKARVVSLVHIAPKEVMAQMAPGEEVSLRVDGQRLLVTNGNDEYLGEVEAKYELRLARLIGGGNRYVAAINSLRENDVKIVIREVYQHPSQAGRPSFPPKERKDFHPYVRESLLRQRAEEEESSEEIDEIAEVEREGYTVADFYQAPTANE